MKLRMSLDSLIIIFQKILSQAWNLSAQPNNKNNITINEFYYLYSVNSAENSEYSQDDSNHNDNSHLSTLANEMQVQKSSASIMLQKLEKKGLVKRINCQYDARAQHILLTKKGRKILTETQNTVFFPITKSIEKILKPEEYKEFEKLLNKIVYSYSNSN